MRRSIHVALLVFCLGAGFWAAIDPSTVLALNVSAGTVNAHLVWDQGITGSGVRVAVLDSGIDTSHPALTGRVIYSIDFTNEGINDLCGHGTHVAGIIASTNNTYKGVAYGCELINVKIGDQSEMWTWSWYRDGVDWCRNHKDAYDIRVISLSFGEPNWDVTLQGIVNHPCDGTCQYCMKAEEAIDEGIVFVACAGNDGFIVGSQSIRCPGCSFNVITVGATDDNNTLGISDDTLCKFSSTGPSKDARPKPDVVAPGQNIISCKANNVNFGTPIDNYFTEASGTSMATPLVSGTVALLLQRNPNLTPAQVKALLRQTARLNSNLDELTINDRGYGIIDAYQSVYRAQSFFLINASLTFDEYAVESNATTDGTNRRVMFNVNS
jgi:serine protease AprX